MDARLVAAPLGRTFAALVDPDALLRWLPPDGMRGRFEHVDLRPGGGYRLVLTYLDPGAGRGKTTADADVVDVRVLRVDVDDRVVFAVDFDSDDPALAGTMTMTWSVTAEAGGTRVELRADDVPDGISAADHAEGLRWSLDQLARHLEG